MTAAAARTDTGRVRQGNEDRYLVRVERGTTLLAVADGVAGEAGGEVAAQAAVDELGGRFFAMARARPLGEALAEAVREANGAVLRAAERTGNGGAASTLVAAAVRGREVVVANLGDSRAYLVRGGVSRQITEDHVGDVASSITRFVGDDRGVQPDVFAETLAPGDRLVLCSDGLTRHASDAEIAALASSHPPLPAAQALVDLALERGGEDNVTVVVHAPGTGGRVRSLGLFLLGMFVGVLLALVAALAAVLLGAPSG